MKTHRLILIAFVAILAACLAPSVTHAAPNNHAHHLEGVIVENEKAATSKPTEKPTEKPTDKTTTTTTSKPTKETVTPTKETAKPTKGTGTPTRETVTPTKSPTKGPTKAHTTKSPPTGTTPTHPPTTTKHSGAFQVSTASFGTLALVAATCAMFLF